jgi:hypothetical protein
MTPQEYADMLTLAQSAYDAYYAPWLRDDSRELIIANIAVKMGVRGCEATFEVRKCVAREMIEKGVCVMEQQAIIELAKHISLRNPGALDVYFRLIDYLQELAVLDIDLLLQREIVGVELYLLFKSCDRDIASLHASLMQGTDIVRLQSCPESKFYQKESV